MEGWFLRVGFVGERRSQGDLCKMSEGLLHLGVLQCTTGWMGRPRKEDLCEWILMLNRWGGLVDVSREKCPKGQGLVI